MTPETIAKIEAEAEIALRNFEYRGSLEEFAKRAYIAGRTAADEEKDKEIKNLKAELGLSEKAHDITIEQLRNTQKARNDWHEMADKLAEEMRKAEWDSPLYWEYKKLWAYYHTGNA